VGLREDIAVDQERYHYKAYARQPYRDKQQDEVNPTIASGALFASSVSAIFAPSASDRGCNSILATSAWRTTRAIVFKLAHEDPQRLGDTRHVPLIRFWDRARRIARNTAARVQKVEVQRVRAERASHVGRARLACKPIGAASVSVRGTFACIFMLGSWKLSR
jgi:hypothetical protein